MSFEAHTRDVDLADLSEEDLDWLAARSLGEGDAGGDDEERLDELFADRLSTEDD